jgi:hypothetical protein
MLSILNQSPNPSCLKGSPPESKFPLPGGLWMKTAHPINYDLGVGVKPPSVLSVFEV